VLELHVILALPLAAPASVILQSFCLSCRRESLIVQRLSARLSARMERLSPEDALLAQAILAVNLA